MMMTKVIEDLSTDLGAVIRNEVAKTNAARDPGTAVAAQALAVEPAGDASPRLPRRISGGFRGVNDELDQRSREWRSTVRLLNQQRLHVETAEAERDRLYEALNRIATEAQESGRSLKSVLDTTKDGDISGDLAAQFVRSQRALEDLETVSEALSTNLSGLRSVWEQYARTIIRAQKMRDDPKAPTGADRH
ncbi:hypothetical protein [Salinarimonas soli]|uniref:Uncharacterized protein n=1 Tax=Salinarimonas soli TaxID=1638099 RepID=A0A5B2VVQ9_9HYPH|nr:hypothetical protein [Salinarimonas soli]KAA2242296.1 hypothetical protein F0L46_03150 [Salinarimonas soli]